jgi:AbrB family looped-hinge helix DNA binding protein
VSTDIVLVTRQRARLTGQGQITVPKAVRDALGARPGDDIEFVPRGDELLIEVRPRRSVLDFAGIAADASDHVPNTAAELDALIEAGMHEAAATRATSEPRQSARRRRR